MPPSPLVAVLHVTGAEDLSRLGGAGGGDILGCLLLKGLADNVLSDTLWAKAVLLTSPAVATVGRSLTVPTAIASVAMNISRAHFLRFCMCNNVI